MASKEDGNSSLSSTGAHTPNVEDTDLALDPKVSVVSATPQPIYEYERVDLERNREISTGTEPTQNILSEYKCSRTSDGTLPRRVLHLKDRRSDSFSGHPFASHKHSKTSCDIAKETDLENETARQIVPSLEKEVPDGESRPDSKLVDWYGPDDPENPMNWSKVKKLQTVLFASMITLIT